jgi:cation diffusion facilitator family transporter
VTTGPADRHETESSLYAASELGAAAEHLRQSRARGIRTTLVQVLFMNLLVVAVKAVAFILSGSLSVLGEVIHSTLDAANNVLALAFARVARKEPDADHPYGHAKFETLGALVIAGFLSISVFEIARGAIRRILNAGAGPEIDPNALTLALIGGSVAAAILVSWWEGRQAQRLGSPILAADAAHTRSDVLGTVAVLAGLFLVRAGYPMADAVVALGVAGLIARSGWHIFRDAVPLLVDERLLAPSLIRDLVRGVPGVKGCHDVRSRGRPGEAFVELVILVDGDRSVREGHAIADQVEELLTEELGARAVSVHVEPDV